jgi:hypothetical protein
MAKRLKKVNIPKEAPKGPFTVPTAPAVLQPAVFTAPPEPSEWAKRVQERVMALRIKQAQHKAAQAPRNAPPLEAAAITSETVLAGKTVKEWDAEIEARVDKAASTKILDLTDLPDWVTWAILKWKANGKPTPLTKVADQVDKLREKAEELVKFANMDKEKAKNQSATKATKLMEAAEKKFAKSAELFKEAADIAKEHMKK